MSETRTRPPAIGLDVRARVTELWATGLSASLIAERIGSTKNAVCGLARRMNLPMRGSPITGVVGQPKAVRPPRVVGPTLKPLASVEGPPAHVVAYRIAIPRVVAPRVIAPRPVVVEAPAPIKAYVPRGTCLYPLWGNDEPPTHKYCDAPISTRSYCATHARRCYGGWVAA